MALPQRKLTSEEYPGTYQYQVRNAQRIEKRRPQLNDDFQYLNKAEFSDASNDDRILSSENPTLRAQNSPRPEEQEAANDPQYEDDEQSPNKLQEALKNKLRRKKGSISISPQKTAIKAAIKSRSSIVSGTIVSWGMTAWYPQLIFAVISIVFLGLMGVGDGVVNSNFVTSAIASITNWATEALTGFLTGTAFTAGDVGAGIYMLLYILILAIGLGTLLIACIQYMMAMMHPLSGEQMGMKYVAILIAIIGYSMPLLNLFPWFLLFVAVVWKYPK